MTPAIEFFRSACAPLSTLLSSVFGPQHQPFQISEESTEFRPAVSIRYLRSRTEYSLKAWRVYQPDKPASEHHSSYSLRASGWSKAIAGNKRTIISAHLFLFSHLSGPTRLCSSRIVNSAEFFVCSLLRLFFALKYFSYAFQNSLCLGSSDMQRSIQ
jgi:hypothetical protein